MTHILRPLEITLKFCFLILAIFLIATSNVISLGFWSFLVISFALGVVLMMNKKPSYKNANAKSDFKLRKVEAIVLIIFALVSLGFLNTL